MPYIIAPRGKRFAAVVAAAFCVALGAAAPAGAAPACTPATGSPVFSAQFNDSADYIPLAGGTFEGDMTGWTLTGASVVSGNEPFYVNSTTDSHSLSISPGGSATSPAFCLSNALPTYRFFAHSAKAGWGATLNVYVRWTDASGAGGIVPAASLSGNAFTSWQPTAALPLGSVLGSGTSVTAQFEFVAGSGSSWSIDDVYLDPYSRG